MKAPQIFWPVVIRDSRELEHLAKQTYLFLPENVWISLFLNWRLTEAVWFTWVSLWCVNEVLSYVTMDLHTCRIESRLGQVEVKRGT